MTEDYRDLAHRLFATATAVLEDTIVVAVAGQSRKRRPGEIVKLAQRLQASARDIVAIAETAGITMRLSLESRNNRPNNC